MTRILSTIVLAMLASLANVTPVQANLLFDVDGAALGNTPKIASTLDLLPANGYFEGIGPVGGQALNVPGKFTSWARLGQILDPSSSVVLTPGLNGSFQITSIIETDIVAQVFGSSVTYSLDPLATVKTFKLYYHSSLTASDLSGTGFQDGTLIYQGTIDSASGAFVQIGETTTPLDLFGANDYPTIDTYAFVGGGVMKVTTTFVDTDFFITAPSGFQFSYNTSLVSPFGEINPSAVSGVSGDPLMLGPINGREPNILLQLDANASVRGEQIIPELATASMGLMSLSAIGLSALRRRRTSAS